MQFLYLFDSQNELAGVRLGRSSDEVDHLIVGVAGDVSPVDHHHLISFVEFWIAPWNKKSNSNVNMVDKTRVESL